tara:strand:- start:6231 stop:6485 length:255 start_codon:yes stop_codon:yes gene_type:complete
MTVFLKNLEKKISEKFNTKKIKLIDKTHLHFKHKSFNSEKFYLKLKIKSEKLKTMKKIDAHKEIYSFLKEDIKEKIHALEIEIE